MIKFDERKVDRNIAKMSLLMVIICWRMEYIFQFIDVAQDFLIILSAFTWDASGWKSANNARCINFNDFSLLKSFYLETKNIIEGAMEQFLFVLFR